MHDLPFTFDALRAAYAGGTTPREVVLEVFRRIEAAGDPGIFISLADRDWCLAEADVLGAPDPARPLYGLPFAVKDNIDAAGLPTTAACPAWTYDPDDDATVVARLRAAGAIVIGKTNLDQFATGLVGTRTPWPVPMNAMDPDLVPGGSSSGSAVAVARGLVSFALGTDTAGSGRIPAGLNNIVGLKPSLGAISNRGVVPACRTLDVVSVLALSVADANAVLQVAAGEDAADPYSRNRPGHPPGPLPESFRFGVPNAGSLEFCGDGLQADAFERDVAALEAIGGVRVPLDFAPFYEVANLLYDGAWVAERHSVVEALMRDQPEAVHPVTAGIIGAARTLSATDAFRGIYRLAELRRETDAALAGVDLLCVPTVPTLFTRAALEADPVGPNTLSGTYTNFVNLLDLCGLTVPTPARGDGRPASVTLLTAGGEDHRLAAIGLALERQGDRKLGATGWAVPEPQPPARTGEPANDEMHIAVCGAHLSGLPLNGQLTTRGARLVEVTETTPDYRLYALPGTPARPGLVRTPGAGAAIALEIWAMPQQHVGSFLAGIPAPLGLGTVRVAGGADVTGFLCEACAVESALDITDYGGWRDWLASEEQVLSRA